MEKDIYILLSLVAPYGEDEIEAATAYESYDAAADYLKTLGTKSRYYRIIPAKLHTEK